MGGAAVAAARTRVATITVSTNDRPWLDDCLSTLTASQVGSHTQLDVILVDNASADGGASHVQSRFPMVSVIRNVNNEGFAGANNRGMQLALERNVDYIFMVNPDTRTPPDLLGRLVTFMRAWPEYGIVGPLQYAYTDDGSPSDSLNQWSRAALKAGESDIFALDGVDHPSPAGPREGRAPRTLEHAYVQGSALFCRADLLRQIGLFDPAYHTYYEESDLCRRARWAGWRVALLLDMGLQHQGEGGTNGSLYRRRHMLRNKYYFLFTDPKWSWPKTGRLAVKWLLRDLTRRGAAPAESRWDAWSDTMVGLVWLLGRWRSIYRRRHEHAVLVRDGTPRRSHPAFGMHP